MALPAKKYYKGAAANAVLTSNPSSGDTTMTVDTVAGWPVSFPFFAVVAAGTSKEEKVKVTAISTLTLTVVRAQDDTSAVAHSAGAAIYPVFTALEASEANEIASIMTTKGDIITNDGSNISRLAVGGTNTHVLQVDSTATNGIKWGQVANGGIADSAITSAKIQDATIVAGDIASATLKLLCPVGTIAAYGGTSAPTGWLLCDGASISASYTELIAQVGSTTPNLKGKVIVGLDSAQTEFDTRFETGGAKTVTLTAAQSGVPAHSHPITDPGHNHAFATKQSASGFGTEFVAEAQFGSDSDQNTELKVTGITVNNNTAANASEAHTNLQPYIVLNYIIKHDY